MGTCNFNIKNRCVVISDEQWEFGDTPSFDKDNDKYNYDSYKNDRDFIGIVDDKEYTNNLISTDLVAFNGYYEASSIDFRQNENLRDDLEYFYTSCNFDSLKEYIYRFDNQGFHYFACRYLRKAVKETVGIKDLDKRIQKINDLIEERCLKRDIKEANKMLDLIKKDYGYSEYEVSARFSSGETHYKKVS